MSPSITVRIRRRDGGTYWIRSSISNGNIQPAGLGPKEFVFWASEKSLDFFGLSLRSSNGISRGEIPREVQSRPMQDEGPFDARAFITRPSVIADKKSLTTRPHDETSRPRLLSRLREKLRRPRATSRAEPSRISTAKLQSAVASSTSRSLCVDRSTSLRSLPFAGSNLRTKPSFIVGIPRPVQGEPGNIIMRAWVYAFSWENVGECPRTRKFRDWSLEIYKLWSMYFRIFPLDTEDVCECNFGA